MKRSPPPPISGPDPFCRVCQELNKNLINLATKLDAFSDDFGTKLEKLDDLGTKLDAFGTKLDAFGTKLDKLDDFGTKLDAFGTKLDDFGTKLDKLDALGTKLDDFGTKLEKMLGAFARCCGCFGAKLDASNNA